MIEKNYVKSEKKGELPFELITFFDKTNTPNDKVTFGYAVFNPGARAPEEGLSCHEQDEYSFIIKGEAKLVIDGKVYTSKAN